MTIKTTALHPRCYEIQHPLLLHKLTLLRDVNTCTKAFKELLNEITMLLVYEATKDLPITTRHVRTPLEVCEAPELAGKKAVVLPILRAGVGMVDGFLSLIPAARVGHIGLYRNETTLQPELYFFKIPSNSADRHFFICDPMLATGGSACAAIEKIKQVGASKITFVCIVAAPAGVARLAQAHPDVPIFTASLDRELNAQSYIVPGLGDAGDRLFGTK